MTAQLEPRGTAAANDDFGRCPRSGEIFPDSRRRVFTPRRDVKAVDGIDFEIRRGETLGLVGESGSGKTTAGRVILRLLRATRGEVGFEGRDILRLDRSDLRSLRKEMQIIFRIRTPRSTRA